MRWQINKTSKKELKLKNPILIEGLPGIGNVGKIAADFIIDEFKGEKIYDVFSHSMPHSVFVNEDNLVELPKIEIYFVKTKHNDLLIISGDMQPIDEESCYEFTDQILSLCEKLYIKNIITLAGIGLHDMPKNPKVFCTGNDKKMIEEYCKDTKMKNKVFGIIGPIMGVSGLLLGLGKKRDIKAISILAETLGHPMYLGVKAAKETLKVLNKKLELELKLNKINKEIKSLEKEIKKAEEISQNQTEKKKGPNENYYIG